ncbi:ribonuclease E activity regulator RraA [Pseudomonas putida]
MSVSTSDLCDQHSAALAAGRLTVLPGNWQWFGSVHSLQGRITTLAAHGCNAELRALLEQPGEGRVLVIDGGGHHGALLGDNLATLALRNGWGGLLIDGKVRDCSALACIKLAIIACGTWPERSHNRAGGKPDVALCLQGAQIQPGDWLYADQDGVLVSASELPEPHDRNAT